MIHPADFHMTQADNISCGPACVMMAARIVLSRTGEDTNITPFMLRDMMGTNPMTGTTDIEMRRGMAAWGLSGSRRKPGHHDRGERMSSLRAAVDGDGMSMLRLMKNGVRHWSVAVGYEEGGFVLLDPSEGGPIVVSEETLAAQMQPRGWESWTLSPDTLCRALQVRPVSGVGIGSMRRACIALAERCFRAHAPLMNFTAYLDYASSWTTSVALCDRKKLLGAYLLKEADACNVLMDAGVNPALANRVQDMLDTRFEGMSGVQGVGLVVPEELRGRGYGRLLRTMPGEMGYEWAYGLQLKSLDNLEAWGKVRDFVLDMGHSWLTAGDVAPLGPLDIADMSTAYKSNPEFATTSTPNTDTATAGMHP